MSKILIIDDEQAIRKALREILEYESFTITEAEDGPTALKILEKETFDVIFCDIKMPRMDGITFLKKIMAEHPTPVVICSTLTEKGAATTMQALAAGAVCYVTKPKLGLKDFLTESATELIRNVKMASQTRPKKIIPTGASAHNAIVKSGNAEALMQTTDKVVAIGTSTGGTQALEMVLTALPRVSPGIVIVQHMPEKFTALFADRLNSICAVEVREAKNGDRVMQGRALIAPGGLHMRLNRSGAYYYVDIVDGPPVNRHKPSVDVLFKSVAQVAGANALGIIMTGMGDDGVRGMLEMHDVGAYTVAQNEESCVVFGMPKEAIKLNAVDIDMPLQNIAGEILRFSRNG